MCYMQAAGEASQEDSAVAAKRRKLARASTTATPVWRSKRPRMWECTEAQFMEDLCAFHRERNHKNVTPENFPDAILNGSRLDLYNLYKEVTSRGGIKFVFASPSALKSEMETFFNDSGSSADVQLLPSAV